MSRWGDVQTQEFQDFAFLNLFFLLCYMFPKVVRRYFTVTARRNYTFGITLLKMGIVQCLFNKEAEGFAALRNEFEPTQLEVKVFPNHLEFQVTYDKSVTNVRLSIRMQETYPIHMLHVELENKTEFSELQATQWTLAFKNLLGNENRSLVEITKLWNLNIEKIFRNVEECSICYYTVYPSDKSLPKMSCKTCKKKFHSICMNKWFASSGKSNCPLCKSIFF